MSVFRYDAGKFKEPVLTPQGYLKAEAYLTRTGVFTYRRADGSIVRELRHPEDVFKSESIKTFAEIPVTDDHPPVLLDAANTKHYARGFTSTDVSKDGDFVKSTITITDNELIQKVMAGKRQCSNGYRCDLEFQPGVWNGQPYDCRQRNIVGNHAAIVDLGRAGPESSVKMDAQDAVMCDENDADWSAAFVNDLPDAAFAYIEAGGKKDETGKTMPRSLRYFPHHNPSVKNPNEEASVDRPHLINALQRVSQSQFGNEAQEHLEMHAKQLKIGKYAEEKNKEDCYMVRITLGGLTHEVEESLGRAVLDAIAAEQKVAEEAKKSAAEVQAKLDSVTKEKDVLQGRFDTADGELKKKEEEIKKLSAKPSRADSLKVARERLTLEALAKSALGEEVSKLNFDTAEDIDIKKAILAKVNPSLNLDGKNADYVEGCFSSYSTQEKLDEAKVNLDKALNQSGGSTNKDGCGKREEYLKKSEDAWKKNLKK